MFEEIKKCGFRIKWNLRQVYKITQYKDGCIYRTKSLGYIVCKPEYQLLNMEDIQIGTVSTKVSNLLINA